MTFGWQGFQIDHPDDWSPANLSGSYKEGYARIASPNRMAIQIRWRAGSAKDLNAALEGYFARLEQQAKKHKQTLSREVSELDGTLTYRWVGPEQGRGSIFERKGRIFFVEATGGKKDSLLPRARESFASFQVFDEELPLWSVLGLAVRIPSAWTLRRHEFVAGKTTLSFDQRFASLECVRWGFAEQLLRDRPLEAWAPAALDLPKAACAMETQGLRLRARQLGKSAAAIVAVQPEVNQIVSLKLTQFRSGDLPPWDWLA